MLSTILSITLLSCFAQEPTTDSKAAAAAPNADVQALLDQPVLQQGDQTYTVHQVLKRLYPYDASLQSALESNDEYLRFYLDSLRFYTQVRWFSNLLILDQHEIPVANRNAQEREARAWSLDRGGNADFPQAILARGGLEVIARARLMEQQPSEFSTREIRSHFNRSVPEFFGRLKISWIRIPLFDMETNRAVGEEERLARYSLLDNVAQQLGAKTISWADAVEKYCEDPVTSRQEGRVGYLKRTDHRFDEEFLRQLFVDFGVTIPRGSILRGPITGSRWLYLVRVESVFTEGVVDLQRVREQVIRSLRVYNMLQRLHNLADGIPRHILLPIQQG